MLIDMDEFESWGKYSGMNCFDPEVESVVVIIENSSRDSRIYELDEVFESSTGFYCTIFDFFENDRITLTYIIEDSFFE
jgi:hypothetical protein